MISLCTSRSALLNQKLWRTLPNQYQLEFVNDIFCVSSFWQNKHQGKVHLMLFSENKYKILKLFWRKLDQKPKTFWQSRIQFST
jgi:hypothetical protein